MKKLVILGGSGIGRIAASIATSMDEYSVMGFLNDVEPVGSHIGKYNPLTVIGKTEDIDLFLEIEDVYFFIAYVGLGNEKETFEKITRMNIPKNRMASLLHHSARIPWPYCNIGDGVLLGPNCVLSPDVTIGDNCILLSNSFVGHDSTLQHFAHVAAGGVVGANVNVGKAVHVGTNSVIREKTRVGDYSLIGCGSVVINDVPENAVVVGNPARVIRFKV